MTGGVLCSGSIIYDVHVRPVGPTEWGTTSLVESIEYCVGGNGASTALALAKLGVPVRLLGAVGRDREGDGLMEILSRAGVDTAAVGRVDAATPASVVLVNEAGDRRILHRPGASQEAFVEPVTFGPGMIAGMSHFHLCSLFILPRMRAHAAATLAGARAAGLTTSLDTNWDAQGRWMQDLESSMPHLDLLFMNEDEARMITGFSDPARAAGVVREKGARAVVVKLSGNGCAIFTEDREMCCPAFDVDAIDTTGAGDCFVAGFLAALRKGATYEQAGRFANGVAALTVQSIGAAENVPAYEETEAWIQSHTNRL